MTRVYLVRHATHDLVGKCLAGRMPGVHLSSQGRSQASGLAEHFAATEITAVLSSPLERCRETAAPIAHRFGLDVEAAESFNEIDCGEWTGQAFDMLADDSRWQSWNRERGRNGVPGGETVQQVQDRAMAALEPLGVGHAGPVIVVTHGDVIKAVILALLGGRLDWHDRLEIDPASITTADLWPGGGKILCMNEAAIS